MAYHTSVSSVRAPQAGCPLKYKDGKPQRFYVLGRPVSAADFQFNVGDLL